ncbi:hypothetical protein ACWCYZ_43425, partial [Streptomyces virginiae]
VGAGHLGHYSFSTLDSMNHSVCLARVTLTERAAPKAARYWLKVWSDLDRPSSTPPRATTTSTAAYADNLAAGLALLNAQKERTP